VNDTPTLPLIDVSRDIDASPDTVWSILTTPALFSKWMEAEVTFESEVGSAFRANFPSFQLVVAGEVVTIDADARHLGLTWGLEAGADAESFPAGCSLVEFRVHEADGGCRVDVRHSQLPTEEHAVQNRAGWGFHLSKMDLYANREDLTSGLERTLAGWFSAWNDQDTESRLETLRASCADDVTFRDEWTDSAGVDLLNVHIGNCFMYMPGWKLEQTGDVRICRGEAIVGWRGVGPGGMAMEGYNHVSADADGTIRRVTGFTAM
jgi:uncharacterized protein YndB with AHSA1/START domain